MMSTQILNQTHTHGHSSSPPVDKSGHCGCSECESSCCSLECLNRPNFFCGQVLTDDDLKAMVDWTNAKGALQRFRDGWGVACGLEVTCSHEPKQKSRVMVSPGYAVDCCGRDIVVCDPLHYDFKCDDPFNPCCPPRKPGNAERLVPVDPAVSDLKLGCIPPDELRAFELCLSFDEKLSGGQRPLARGKCVPLDDCQYTRVIETGKLTAREITDPCVAKPKLSEERYRREFKLFLNDLKRNSGSAEILLDWVRGKMHSFCFIEECICEAIDQTRLKETEERDRRRRNRTTPQRVDVTVDPEWLLYIIQDWRNHFFQCLCESCDGACDGNGVPLARVWVWNRDKDDCKFCKVAFIDSYPPYRRLLGRSCWPSDPNCIDLTRYIWRDVAEVENELMNHGLYAVEKYEISVPQYLENIGNEKMDLVCAPYRTPLIVGTRPDVCGRQRVVTFQSGQNQ